MSRKRKIAPTKYIKKLEEQDVNKLKRFKAEEANCRLPHDYTEWQTLHGPVTSFKMTKEEMDEYFNR